jgi:hypothetical protein
VIAPELDHLFRSALDALKVVEDLGIEASSCTCSWAATSQATACPSCS